MEVAVKKMDKLKRVININIGDEEFKEEKMKLYRSSGKKLNVPGFREGTAPVDILEKHHGAVLKDEFLKWAIPFYY